MELFISGYAPSSVLADFPDVQICHYANPGAEFWTTNDYVRDVDLETYYASVQTDLTNTYLPIMLDAEHSSHFQKFLHQQGYTSKNSKHFFRRFLSRSRQLHPTARLGFYSIPQILDYFAPAHTGQHAEYNFRAGIDVSLFEGLSNMVLMPSIYENGPLSGTPTLYYIQNIMQFTKKMQNYLAPRCEFMPIVSDRSYINEQPDGTNTPQITDSVYLSGFYSGIINDINNPSAVVYWNQSLYYENAINPVGATTRAENRVRDTLTLLLHNIGGDRISRLFD